MSWYEFKESVIELSSHLERILTYMPDEPISGIDLESGTGTAIEPNEIINYLRRATIVGANLVDEAEDWYIKGLLHVREAEHTDIVHPKHYLDDAKDAFETALERPGDKHKRKSEQFLDKIFKGKWNSRIDHTSPSETPSSIERIQETRAFQKDIRDLCIFLPTYLHTIPDEPFVYIGDDGIGKISNFLPHMAALDLFRLGTQLRDHPDNHHYLGKTALLLHLMNGSSEYLEEAQFHLQQAVLDRKTPRPKDAYWFGRATINRALDDDDEQLLKEAIETLQLSHSDSYYKQDAYEAEGYGIIEFSLKEPDNRFQDAKNGLTILARYAHLNGSATAAKEVADQAVRIAEEMIIPPHARYFFEKAQAAYRVAIAKGMDSKDVRNSLHFVDDELRYDFE